MLVKKAGFTILLSWPDMRDIRSLTRIIGEVMEGGGGSYGGEEGGTRPGVCLGKRGHFGP